MSILNILNGIIRNPRSYGNKIIFMKLTGRLEQEVNSLFTDYRNLQPAIRFKTREAEELRRQAEVLRAQGDSSCMR